LFNSAGQLMTSVIDSVAGLFGLDGDEESAAVGSHIVRRAEPRDLPHLKKRARQLYAAGYTQFVVNPQQVITDGVFVSASFGMVYGL
jgi:hypothetical protein